MRLVDNVKWLGRGRQVALAATTFLCAAAVHAGCSSSPVEEEGTDGGTSSNDATAPIDGAKPNDAAGNKDTGPADSGPPPCADVPTFDCSKTAGSVNVDDAGLQTGSGAQVPYDLRCTGLYSCFSNKTVAASHRNYAPAYKLYSDGAEKQRWLYLPPGSKIDVGAGNFGGTADDFVFPVGTTVYKEFQLNGKRIETRRIWKAGAGDFVYSVYRWADDESSAVLTFSGATIPNPAKPGSVYEIPAPTKCEVCHQGHTNRFLSLDAWGLGGAGATGLTLASMQAEGLLDGWTRGTSLTLGEDKSGKLNGAMGFYYNNCGFCHKPNTGQAKGTGLFLHMPVPADGGTTLNAADLPLITTAVNVNHNNPGAGGMYPTASGYRRVVPGDPAKSVVLIRDNLRNPDGGIETVPFAQMPNTIVRTTDTAGLAATQAWISDPLAGQ